MDKSGTGKPGNGRLGSVWFDPGKEIAASRFRSTAFSDPFGPIGTRQALTDALHPVLRLGHAVEDLVRLGWEDARA